MNVRCMVSFYCLCVFVGPVFFLVLLVNAVLAVNYVMLWELKLFAVVLFGALVLLLLMGLML